MPGLSIVAAGSDPARLHAAFSVAAAWAALDRPAAIFLHVEAVILLSQPAADLECPSAAGAPTIRELLTEAMALGVKIVACQSGMAMAGISAESLPRGIESGGLVSFLADCGEDQVMMA